MENYLTYLGELHRGLIFIQHAHLVCQSVANDQSQRIDGGRDQQPVRPAQLLTNAEETRVKPGRDKCIGKN